MARGTMTPITVQNTHQETKRDSNDKQTGRDSNHVK